jgi:hypothetical protein
MHDTLLSYFNGEKHAGLCIAAIGAAGVAAALVFYQPRWDVRAFAITLGVLALVEIAIGVGLYVKTGPQLDALVTQLAADPPGFHAAESARMTGVQRNFVILEHVWLVLLAASALTAILMKHRFAVAGVALGLLVNFAIILAFDLVAERRGAVYLKALSTVSTGDGVRKFGNSATAPPAPSAAR